MRKEDKPLILGSTATFRKTVAIRHDWGQGMFSGVGLWRTRRASSLRQNRFDRDRLRGASSFNCVRVLFDSDPRAVWAFTAQRGFRLDFPSKCAVPAATLPQLQSMARQ